MAGLVHDGARMTDLFDHSKQWTPQNWFLRKLYWLFIKPVLDFHWPLKFPLYCIAAAFLFVVTIGVPGIVFQLFIGHEESVRLLDPLLSVADWVTNNFSPDKGEYGYLLPGYFLAYQIAWGIYWGLTSLWMCFHNRVGYLMVGMWTVYFFLVSGIGALIVQSKWWLKVWGFGMMNHLL